MASPSKDMLVENMAIERLIPYTNNPRKISKKAVDKVAGSIAEYGWRQPIVVDKKGVVVVGHTRLLAAQKLGLKEVPVHVADLTAAQAKAYRLADNRTNQEATWDFELLSLELEGLNGLDLSLTGFDKIELNMLLKPLGGLTDEDSVPEAPEEPITQDGDVWACGEHRVICGDATDPQCVERLLDGAKPNLMVTDPPYGVKYKDIINDHIADWREAWVLFPGGVAYVWHADLRAKEAIEALEVCGFELRAQIIWSKSALVMSRGDYHFQHEPCWYAVRKGANGNWRGDRKQTTVWNIDKPMKSETGHSTQKPVECMRRPIVHHTETGDAVYDPFLGSGTTMIAAETTKRVCYGIEISPQYVDVAVKRWEQFTGQEAVKLPSRKDDVQTD